MPNPKVSPVANVLTVTNLAVNYGDARAVHDVSLAVGAGQITAVLGSNGAGKTTTLHAIAGLLPARAGQILLDGKDITGRPAHEIPALGLSLVQQGKRIFPGLTVEANLLVATHPHKLRRQSRLKLIDEAYERFPMLAEKRRAYAGSLSGGQQQMLAIGQSLMAKPRLLMLDEPSAGLSPAIVKEVLRTVAALAADGMGILIVEQLVEDVMAISHDVVVIDEGRVAVSGPVDTVATDRRLMDAYLGLQL
jgi:branched-chain amino acid transport system ATP-binding protein